MLEMLLPMLGIKKEDLPPPETLQQGFACIAAFPETLQRLENKLDLLLSRANIAPVANNEKPLIAHVGEEND